MSAKPAAALNFAVVPAAGDTKKAKQKPITFTNNNDEYELWVIAGLRSEINDNQLSECDHNTLVSYFSENSPDHARLAGRTETATIPLTKDSYLVACAFKVMKSSAVPPFPLGGGAAGTPGGVGSAAPTPAPPTPAPPTPAPPTPAPPTPAPPTPAPPTPAPSVGIVVAYQKMDSLAAVGITQILMLDSSRSAVKLPTAEHLLDEWRRSTEPTTFDASNLFVRTGKWAYREAAALTFVVGTGTTSINIHAWLEMAKIAYLRFGVELGNTYGFKFCDHGSAVAMPLLLVGGVDLTFLRNSNFFFGIHGFVSPSFEFSQNDIKQLISFAFGGRIEFNGYVAVGAGYQIDLQADNYGFVSLSIGPDLFKVLRTK